MKEFKCCKVTNSKSEVVADIFCNKDAATFYLEIHPTEDNHKDVDISPFCADHDYPWAGVKISKAQAQKIWDLIH